MKVLTLTFSTYSLCINLKIQRMNLKNRDQNYKERFLRSYKYMVLFSFAT